MIKRNNELYKIKVYLAHSFELMKIVKKEIIPDIKGLIEVLNPFEGRYDILEVLDDEEIIKKYYKKTTSVNWIIKHDLRMIEEADALIAYSPEKPSIGTTMEIVYAYHMNKPVGIFTGEKYKNHPWYNYHSVIISNNMLQIINELEQYFW